jgi:serine/threonine protein kinase
VYRVQRDPNNPRVFHLTFMENYDFEADSPEQVEQIIEAFQSVGIPRAKFQELLEEELKEAQATKQSVTESIAYTDKGDGAAVAEAASASSGAPLSINDFELLKVIGQGSFGKVLQVKKKDTGKIYAMKILKKAELVKRNQIEHTKSEREILGSLRHPFMVKLHYSFQTENKLYMVMDYVNGGELYYHLQKTGTFPMEQARHYVAQVVLVLEYLHSRNVVYRDLKPENMLIDEDGYVIITDFGLSKLGITSVGGTGAGQATATFCGTPEYLAPEILTGTVHGIAVDWWAVGIMLYEMLVGASPFYSENRKELYDNTLKGRLNFPKDMDPDAENLIRGLLHPDPVKRLGSGPSGAAEIRSHKFFALIDWKKLYNKEIVPYFVPRVKSGKLDTSNVHPHYLEQKAVDSLQEDASLAGLASQADFKGFEFSTDDKQ